MKCMTMLLNDLNMAWGSENSALPSLFFHAKKTAKTALVLLN